MKYTPSRGNLVDSQFVCVYVCVHVCVYVCVFLLVADGLFTDTRFRFLGMYLFP